MSTHFDDIEKQARSLSLKEKATLARVLIEDLDTSADENVEHLWIEEAKRRLAAYLKGELDALPGEEVMARTRNRLK
jgi:putative addiction module component (TIGR02574 family)